MATLRPKTKTPPIFEGLDGAYRTGAELDPEEHRYWGFLRPMRIDYRQIDFSSPLRFNLSLAKQMKTTIVLNLLSELIPMAALIAIPQLIGKAVDAHLERGFTGEFWWIIGALGLCGLILAGGYGLGQLTGIATWTRNVMPVGRAISRRGARNGIAILRQMGSGDAVTVAALDLYRFPIVWQTINFIGAVILIASVSGIMLSYSLVLGLTTVIGLPLISVAVIFIAKPLAARADEQRAKTSKLTVGATDAIAGLRILRGIGGQDQFLQRYRANSQVLKESGYRVAFYDAVLAAVQTGLPGLFSVVLLWVGISQVNQGLLSPGELLAMVGLVEVLQRGLMQLISYMREAPRALAGTKRILRLMNVEPDRTFAPDSKPWVIPNWQVANLADAESGLRVAAGQFVALVGRQGSELEAIAKRLGAVPYTTGVSVNGIDFSEIPKSELRANIVYQGPQVQIFSGTLRENVSSAKVSEPRARQRLELLQAENENLDWSDRLTRVESPEMPGDERWLAALTAADCEDVLTSLPNGLGGMILEKGRSLSGGQRQRVALARSLATNAPIMVLVDPTSAVDSHTEARVGERMRLARAGKTTVVVSTSPLLIEQADQVCYIEDGRVVAATTHDDLLQRAGRGEPLAQRYRATVTRALGEVLDATTDC